MKSLAAVMPSPALTVIAPPPTALSPTLPHGLTEMAGSMTPQQLSVAMTPRQTPLTRDEARALQQWKRVLWSYRVSLRGDLDTEPGKQHLRELRASCGADHLFKIKIDGKWTMTSRIYAIPKELSIEHIQAVLIEMVRPAAPESVVRISQVMMRKPIFNNDAVSAGQAISDTHELLSKYSDFVYFETCQDAMDDDDKYFPRPNLWEKWAAENANTVLTWKDIFELGQSIPEEEYAQ